jgi:phosphoribosyl 1,2-cyclic phosphodiesterase
LSRDTLGSDVRIRFWGTRGSIAAPGPSTVRYGGNTSCVELRSDSGTLVVFDCGTGARELGRALVAEAAQNGASPNGVILLGHTHWDHIQGLPFFTPAFQSRNHFRLWGAPTLLRSLEVVLRQQMSPVVFPIPFESLHARMEFSELAQHHIAGNGYDVRAMNVRHPGGALGFRIEPHDRPDRSVVFIPDNELDRFGDQADDASSREALVGFARHPRVLIHDAMYTGTEYMEHRGWGHSSYRDAVDFAIAAEVETLVLFHHDPERTDEGLHEQLGLCRQMVRERGGATVIVAAAEGLEVDL